MPLHPPDPPAVVCTLQRRDEGGLVVIGGMVQSQQTGEGRYRLEVVKSGPAGVSTIRQSGRFSIVPGQTVQIGHAALSIEAAAHYKVELSVEAAGRTIACQDEGRPK